MKHRPGPGRPTVAKLSDECGLRPSDGSALFCGLPRDHGDKWHQMCRPGQRDAVFFLVTDMTILFPSTGGTTNIPALENSL